MTILVLGCTGHLRAMLPLELPQGSLDRHGAAVGLNLDLIGNLNGFLSDPGHGNLPLRCSVRLDAAGLPEIVLTKPRRAPLRRACVVELRDH